MITWDEDDHSDQGLPGTGCRGADPGGGHVVTIVITNKGKYPIADATAYNHYSLLRCYEAAFGLPPPRARWRCSGGPDDSTAPPVVWPDFQAAKNAREGS